MFEPYMDNKVFPKDYLESLYADGLIALGQNIQGCVDSGHWGDDTYFDYLPAGQDFLQAFWDVMQFEATKLYAHIDYLFIATEGLGGEPVEKMLDALDKLDKLVVLIDPDMDISDYASWLYPTKFKAVQPGRLLKLEHTQDYLWVKLPEEFTKEHEAHQKILKGL
jgi:hypothetical protein